MTRNKNCIIKLSTYCFNIVLVIFFISIKYTPSYSIHVVNVPNNSPTKKPDLVLHAPAYINAIAWNNDASRLAVMSEFGSQITIYETAQWKIVKNFSRFSNSYSFNSMSFLADTTLLVSAPMARSNDNPNIRATDNSLEHIDIETGLRLQYVKDNNNQIPASWKMMYTFAVSKDSSLAAGIPIGNNKIVSLFNTDNWSWQRNISIPQNLGNGLSAFSLAFSPNSDEIAIGLSRGKMEIFKSETGELIHQFDLFDDEFVTNAIGFSPNGNYLAAGKSLGSHLSGDAVVLLRTTDWSSIPIPKGEENPFHKSGAVSIWSLTWNSNDELAIGDSNSLKVWKINNEFSAQKLNVLSEQGFYSVKFASDGRLAASTGNEVWIYKSF